MKIINEFASVIIEMDTNGNSPRLKIQNSRTGKSIYLDALQLESLTLQPDEIFHEFLKFPFGPKVN